MEINDIIEVKPLNIKMKHRCSPSRCNSRKFRVKAIRTCIIQGLEYDILLESLDKVFSVGYHKTPDMFWVKVGREIEIIGVIDSDKEKQDGI